MFQRDVSVSKSATVDTTMSQKSILIKKQKDSPLAVTLSDDTKPGAGGLERGSKPLDGGSDIQIRKPSEGAAHRQSDPRINKASKRASSLERLVNIKKSASGTRKAKILTGNTADNEQATSNKVKVRGFLN